MTRPRSALPRTRRYAFVDPRWLRLFGVVDALGARLWPRRPAPGTPPTRVLLVNLAHLGDVVLSTAALRTVRAALPDAHVAMLVSPASAPVLEGHPAIDQLVRFDATWWRRADRRLFDPGGIRRLADLLRQGRYDLVFQLKSFFQENLAGALAGVPRRVGYGIYGGGFLHTEEVAHPWGAHTVVQNQTLLDAGGMPDPAPRLDLRPRPQDEAAAAAALAGAGGPLVAIHPGAGTPSKRWPLERFVAVGERLAARGIRVVLVGGPDDVTLAADYRAAATRPPIDTCGRLHPLASAAVLRRCTGFVGGDSAPAHLAAAMDVPTVAVFSGTNVAALWSPWGAAVEVLQTRPVCSPCGLDTCPLPGHDCLAAISPDDVVRALDRVRVEREDTNRD